MLTSVNAGGPVWVWQLPKKTSLCSSFCSLSLSSPERLHPQPSSLGRFLARKWPVFYMFCLSLPFMLWNTKKQTVDNKEKWPKYNDCRRPTTSPLEIKGQIKKIGMFRPRITSFKARSKNKELHPKQTWTILKAWPSIRSKTISQQTFF